MAFFGIIKTNRESILEIFKTEMEKFEKFYFNDKISTFGREEFYDICNSHLKNGSKSTTLKKFLKVKEIENQFIINSLKEIQSLEEEFPNETNSISSFKDKFISVEDMMMNFKEDKEEFVKLQLSKDYYKKRVKKLNREISEFNFEIDKIKIITDSFDEFDISVVSIEEVKTRISYLENYMEMMKELSNFFKNKHHLPVLGNEDDIVEINKLYNSVDYDNFDNGKFNKFLAYRELMREQIDSSYSFIEFSNEIKEKIGDFRLGISVNPLLDDLFKFNFDKIEEKYAIILGNYRSKEFEYIKLLDSLTELGNEVDDKLKDYNKVMKLLNNVLKMLDIEKEEEIKDINEYFLYSISKNIEKINNIYGTSKEISENDTLNLVDLVERFLYKLTKDQLYAINKSIEYMNKDFTSSCLIQGDVSSGKTIVTVILMFIMGLKNKKSIYIVPRLILRQQHLKTLRKYNDLFCLDLNIYDINEEFDIRDADIVLSGYSMNDARLDMVDFELGIVDEIQLFGVEQRNEVQKKYPNIDMFYTTATPHPRTKLISLIGNMDIIEIKELPPGRKLKNTIIFDKMNDEIITRIRKEVDKGHSVLVVSPLVNSAGYGEFENVKFAFQKYSEIFQDLNVQMMLSNYSEEKKNEIIENVIDGNINILVTTKMIEVGVDIPNASVIIIHYPYKQKIKWGVSQLHQLRGRVGRNNQDSFCYIETNGIPEVGSPIDSVLKTQDVFELTKNDFNWRGFHKIIGTKQSGRNSQKYLEKKIKAYEIIAKNTPNLIDKLDETFIKNIEKELENRRIENLN